MYGTRLTSVIRRGHSYTSNGHRLAQVFNSDSLGENTHGLLPRSVAQLSEYDGLRRLPVLGLLVLLLVRVGYIGCAVFTSPGMFP